MSHSEAHQVEGLEVTEAPALSVAEYLELLNGRARLDVPHVGGEKVVPMRGTVPEAWALA